MMQSISEMFFTLSGRMDVEFVKIFSEKLKITDGDYGFFVNHVGKRMYEFGSLTLGLSKIVHKR